MPIKTNDIFSAAIDDTKRNAAFRKLTKAQKRVAIAKDVISSIEMERYTARVGCYLSYKTVLDLEGDTQLQEVMLSAKTDCRVCALGAVFTSVVKVKNAITVDDYHYGIRSTSGIRGVMYEYLGGIFSDSQLALIESAFEMDEFSSEVGVKPRNVVDAIGFGFKFEEDTDRLLAIMRNIIKNKGMFVPPKASKNVKEAIADGYMPCDGTIREWRQEQRL